MLAEAQGQGKSKPSQDSPDEQEGRK